MSTQPDTMRKAFEAWQSSQDQAEPEPERVYEFSEDGMNELIQEVMFEAWHAATEHAARVCERLGPDSTNAQCADAVRGGSA